MALRARYCGVRAGQRKGRVVVIEGGHGPRRGVVAVGAGGGEPGSGVGRIIGSVPIHRVAGVAIGRNGCVVAVCVALHAGHGEMCPGQRKGARRVIESGCGPAAGGMADAAIGGEAGSDVIGIRCSRESGLMAGVAGRRRGCVAVVRMALRTRHGCMHTRQRIVCIERMVERSVEPVGRRMAKGAVLRQTKLCVGRIGCAQKILAVATIAGGRSPLVHIVDVAGGASQRGVGSGQRIAGVLQVIELGSYPTVHGVAALATGREPSGHMIQNWRLEVLLMA